jgi:cell division protein FtsN
MSDGFFNFNRPRRQIEPSMPDERGLDLGGVQPFTPDQSATDRRDPGADALLELARLIGQTDPFAPVSGRPDEVHKSDGRLASVSADVLRAAASPTAGAKDPFTRPPAREPTQSHDRSRDDRSSQNPSYHDQSYEDRPAEDRFRQHQPFEGRSSEARSSLDRGAPVRRDPDFGLSRVPVQPTHPDTDHSETSHTDESYDFLQLPGRGDYPVAPRQALADEGDYDHGDHHEGPMTARRYPVYGQQHEEHADEYREDEYGQDGDHEYDPEHDNPEDGEPGVKRRRGTKVVIAVLGLAVFGSAAALGYRTIFKAAPSDPTPIIRADKSPTKMTPTGTDTNAKQANGRFGNSAEQLVRRDEEPVDVGSPFRSAAVDAAGRLPNAAGSSPPEIVPATVGPAPPGDTKRVRTVTIRADQGAAASDRTPSRVSPPPQSQPPLPRQAAASPAPTPSSAPMAIAPEAAVPRAVEAGGGGFVVQLSAQRSEAEAQAAFRILQAKYSMLSGHQALIRRKDQGEKGIFYAAQVGPFGTKADAVQLCETLKAAGGSCYIPKD